MTQKENLRMSQASTIINWNQIYNILPYRLGLQFWCRKLDLVALCEEVLGEQPLTMKGSTPTLLTLTARTSPSYRRRKLQPLVDGWQWTLIVAKSYGLQPILAIPPLRVLLLCLMTFSLPDQLIQKDPYMQRKPKQEKFYGLMKLEPLYVYGGMSVSDGCIYVGNGYTLGLGGLNPSYTAGKSLFAFCLTWVLVRENIYTYYIYWANNKAWNCFFFFFMTMHETIISSIVPLKM